MKVQLHISGKANAENAIVIRNASAVVKIYKEEWTRPWDELETD
jgi:hypothetical protein